MNLPCLQTIRELFYENLKENCLQNKDDDFIIYVFPQLWGSTALGFDCVGLSAMTRAYTTVIIDQYSGASGVFFGGKLAYIIKNPNDLFFDDIDQRNMNGCSDKMQYERR